MRHRVTAGRLGKLGLTLFALAGVFFSLFASVLDPVVWAAWGTVIEKRDYLWDCLQEMIAIGQEHGARWVKCGRVSAAGHPHHPLYLRADSRIEDFPVEEYAARRPAAKKKRRGCR